MEDNRELLVDPEPFATLLLALGAAGSVASILAYVDSRVSDYREERKANRFAARDAIMGVETSLNELRASVRSLEIAFAAGSKADTRTDSGNVLAKFGRISLVFTRDGYDRWNEIEQDILTTTSRLHRHMNNLLRLFATTKMKLRSDTAKRIQSAVEEMNHIVGRLSQIHFGDLFCELETLIGNCGDAMRQLRGEVDRDW